MEYRTLPGGDEIPVVGLGTWGVGGMMSPNRQKDRESIDILRYAISMGYTHLDTAEMYGGGHCEEIIGKAIQVFNRTDLFITTKVSPSNLSYRGVLKSLENSLTRMGIEHVDLFLIHWPNPRISLEETFDGLNKLVREGKARYLGVSNFDLIRLKEAESLSETPIVTNQIPYSLVDREYVDNGVVEYCQNQGVIITAYSPIKSVNMASITLQKIAKSIGGSPAQVALNWLITQQDVITIPKSTNRARLRENLGCLDLQLDEEIRSALDNYQK